MSGETKMLNCEISPTCITAGKPFAELSNDELELIRQSCTAYGFSKIWGIFQAAVEKAKEL